MKRFTSLVALATLVPLGAAGQAAAATATATLAANSAYVWRGLTFNDGLVLQPSMDVRQGGFAFNVWGNLDLDDYNGAVDDGEEVDPAPGQPHHVRVADREPHRSPSRGTGSRSSGCRRAPCGARSGAGTARRAPHRPGRLIPHGPPFSSWRADV